MKYKGVHERKMTDKAWRRRKIIFAIEFVLMMAIVAAVILVPMWAMGCLLHMIGV